MRYREEWERDGFFLEYARAWEYAGFRPSACILDDRRKAVSWSKYFTDPEEASIWERSRIKSPAAAYHLMDAGITPLIYKQCEWKSHFGSGSRAYDQDHYEMWCRDPHVNLHYNEPELAAIIQRWVNTRDVFFAFDHWTKSLKFIMVDDLRATCPNYDWIDIACVGQFPCLTSLGLVYIAKAPIDILMQALKMGKTIPVLFESESSVCSLGRRILAILIN